MKAVDKVDFSTLLVIGIANIVDSFRMMVVGEHNTIEWVAII